MWLNYHLAAPDVLWTALIPMATLETSLEAKFDMQAERQAGRQADWQKKRLIGTQATALPKNCI